MAERSREAALEQAGLLHPAPETVTAPVFIERPDFFAAVDKVQVKYEMLRAHLLEGDSVTDLCLSLFPRSGRVLRSQVRGSSGVGRDGTWSG